MKFGTELYNKNDCEAIKVLKDFLPDKIFDAHAHVVDCDFVPALRGNYDNNIATSEDYKNQKSRKGENICSITICSCTNLIGRHSMH